MSVQSLYARGRYLGAYALAAAQHGPLAGWRHDAARLVLGSRLAGNLGGDRLAHALVLRARRAAGDPGASATDRTEAALYHAFRTFGRRGPLALRRFFQRPGVRAAFAADDHPETRADALCLQAQIAAAYRDHDAAEALWRQARALAPEHPWLWRERAALLAAADRYSESLDAARESLRLQPWYRPGVQQAAHVLTLLGRDEEAAALLADALDPQRGGLESAAVAGQLAELRLELLRPAPALEALERYEAFTPLLEESGRLWLASRRGEARLLLGDLPGSAAAAEPVAATSYFYEKTVARLRDPARQGARRVCHAVPFVRQHERTCAPATLAALSHFWGRPAGHAAIAGEICYGGTFEHQERRWAETHGWVAREFRADWPAAVALLDAGIPFTLATAGVNSGHLQAVVGYDARRGTLILRDPYERNQSEALAEEFLARHAFGGPRALALAPADDPAAAAFLRAAALPEAALYDRLYRLRRALHVHDRPEARAALGELDALDPAARLTWFARRELAAYDGDAPAALDAVEGLLALFPGEGRLRLEKLHALRRLARPAEARAWLETCAADRARAEPNLWRELARELAADARQRPRARQLLARSLFYEPTEAEHLRALAELRWDQRDYPEAAALFRFAATAAAVREDAWQQFFAASRHLGEADAALRLLDARFARLGGQSSQPARTLHWARRERHEFAPAAAVLDAALRRRPDDGDLLLFAASVHARDGEHAAAGALLSRAEGRAPAGAFLRTGAELAELAGDLAGALARWQGVLAREPLDPAAHRAAARLLEETDARGPAAARAHLDAAAARFPHAVALHEIRVAALADEPGRGTPAHAAAVEALLAVQPTNVWAHRERALACRAGDDLPAAFAALGEAARLDPLAPPTHALLGHLLLADGQLSEARASLRRALELDADLPAALADLLAASPTQAEQRAALDFMRAQLVGQPFVGPGIPAYRAAAYPVLAEAELQGQLDAILDARPDLWQAWSAVVWQHADAARLDPARVRAQTAAERFPLLPRVWLDLAAVARLQGDDAAQIEALKRALRIRSAYGEASRQLALAHRRAGRLAEARAVLEQAIAAAPSDVANRGALAETLWQTDRAAHGAQVLEILAAAVRREPGYDWAWETLERNARQLGQPARAGEAARQLAAARPGEARSWLRLAQTLAAASGPGLAERLAALDRALALNPRLDDAHDLRAFLLAEAGRFDEALAACEPPTVNYGGARPFRLAGRAAWVLARRGDLAAARAAMRPLLADHPGYQWGWRMLADWAEAAGDQPETLAAAERLAFFSPHAAPPLGYLAAARLALGQRAEAKAALREAMRRDPAYLYAPATLLRIQVEDGELDDAEATLAFLARHDPGPATLARTVRLALRQKEPRRALAAFAELVRTCPAPGADEGDLPAAARALRDAGLHQETEDALHAALLAPAASHPEAGPAWVRRRAERGRWRRLGRTVRRLPGGEFARRTRLAYLNALAERRRSFDALWFVWRLRATLRVDTESWGQAGYALTGCGWHGWAAHWLADYAARPDAEGWMLANLAASLRGLARHGRALVVNRHALALPPDHTRAKHVAWVALEDALTDGEEARQRAARLHAEILPTLEEQPQPFHYLLHLTGQTLAMREAARSADPAARRAAYRTARETMRRERQLVAQTFRTLQHPAYQAERRARRRWARDSGLWWPRARLWLFSPPVPVFGQVLFVLAWMMAMALAFSAAVSLLTLAQLSG